MIPLVANWIPVQTSGSAICRYNPTANRREYDVRYQIGDIGNLVHELTHVAINESYGLDFVNYTNEQAKGVPPAKYTGQGYRSNEAERQTRQMDAGKNAANGKVLQSLMGWATAARELTPIQIQEINNKLSYGAINPQKEYDTVINQILVWLNEWGCRIP